MIAWSFAKKERISSPVAYCPVLVFLGLSTSLSFSNRISPNCFGEAMLNSSPASLKILASRVLMSLSNFSEREFRNFSSRLMPSNSISAKTRNSGISISSNNFWVLASPNSFSKCSLSCKVISASSTAYSVCLSKGIARIES